MYWSTKSFGGKDYIVLQHPLRGTSTVVAGVKFHQGYGVVETNGKLYKNIKKMPLFRNAKEYSILMLQNLNFITRTKDIEIIYGKDIYISFQRALTAFKKQEEDARFEKEKSSRETGESVKCKYLILPGQYCKNDYIQGTNGYCRIHLLTDIELLTEMGIEVPSWVGQKGNKKETHEYVAKLIKKIEKYQKEKSRKQLKDVLDSDSKDSTQEVING